jgi:methionine aminotransferase
MPQFPGSVPNKLPNTGTTIFTRMSALAAERGAINLSQGFPDFDPDRRLVNAVAKAMRSHQNQYAPMPGWLPLREALARKIEQQCGAVFSPEAEITITAGATQAIFTAMQAIVREGDEVICLDPAYDCYVPAIRLAGGEAIRIPLDAERGYAMPWGAVKARINGRTRMIVVNNPHNPTGAVWSTEDLKQLERLTKGTDIIVLADEVYEHLVFDGAQHQSVLRLPKLAERSIAVYSFGKTYHCTGWKVGYCVAPENLMEAFRRVHQYEVFCVNRPVQVALAEFLEDAEAYTGLPAFYQPKRDHFRALLADSRFKLLPCPGTYFQLLDYSAITDEPDAEFALRLTGEHGVAAIPVSGFYRRPEQHQVLRFCFAKSEKTLEQAAERLCAV